MRVQNIQNNQNFTGIKLQTITAPARDITVYRLTEKDKGFINSLLNNSDKFISKDKLAIGKGTNKEIFETALKSATNSFYDKTLIAMGKGKKILGVLHLHNDADNELAELVCMNGGKKQPARIVRESLMLAALKETKKLKDMAIFVKEKEFKPTIAKFLNSFGFKTESSPYGKEMYIECQDLQKAIDKYGYYSPNKIQQIHHGNDISLNRFINANN